MEIAGSGFVRHLSSFVLTAMLSLLVLTSGCTQPPVANFEAEPTLGGPAPMPVQFIDKSTGKGITSHEWQYKLNPENSLDLLNSERYQWTQFFPNKNSEYTFERAGSYDIKLKVTGRGGSDEMIKKDYINIGCDFSKKTGIERCFGGIGSQCDGIQILGIGPVPFRKDESTCKVEGQVSVGSILHDRCCLATNCEGWSCIERDKGDNTRCKDEWQLAWDSTKYSVLGSPRQWVHFFGPYPLGNMGDEIFMTNESIPAKIKAPPGTRMIPNYQKYYCQSGRCKEENGAPKIENDLYGEYCVCE